MTKTLCSTASQIAKCPRIRFRTRPTGWLFLLEQTAEECAELAHACLKMSRNLRGENPTPVADVWIKASVQEELADLMNCVDIMLHIPWINAKRVQDIQIEKIKRWGERIREE